MSQFITYKADCPGCGAKNVQWTGTSGDVPKEENKYVIDCKACIKKETSWRDGERRGRLHMPTAVKPAVLAMRMRAARP